MLSAPEALTRKIKEAKMLKGGQIVCDFCFQPIGAFRHVSFRKPGTDGKNDADYEQYHSRFGGDCYGKVIQREVEETNEKRRIRAI